MIWWICQRLVDLRFYEDLGGFVVVCAHHLKNHVAEHNSKLTEIPLRFGVSFCPLGKHMRN